MALSRRPTLYLKRVPRNFIYLSVFVYRIWIQLVRPSLAMQSAGLAQVGTIYIEVIHT
jgi:hypothetical protein